MTQNKKYTKDKWLLFISEHKALCRICSFIQYGRSRIGLNKALKAQAEETMNTFNATWGREMLDVFYSYFRYMITPKEYFLYNFRKLNERGRQDFVGTLRLFVFWHKIWNEKICELYDNKWRTYQVYRKYYGREVIEISSETDFSDFYSFTERHHRFIIKPEREYGGKGIYIAEVHNKKDALKLFDEIRRDGNSVVEELITQDSEMARFYPDSVNTIRFVTFYHKDRLTKICAVLRMGRNGSVVDNVTYGGICVPIDMEHGIAYTYAESYKGEKYAYHPDTGVQILGAKIPKWMELNHLIENLVKVVPEQKMIGWDMALTPAGWVVVEANHNPASQDLVHDHGLREVMHDFYEVAYE